MRNLLMPIVVMAACGATRPTTRPVDRAAAQVKENLPVIDPYPPTLRQDIHDTLFGTPVADPYRWLEDEKAGPVKAWMTAQNDYARKRLAALPGREALTERLRELLYVDSFTPPRKRGNRYFYSRTHADREKAVHYFRDGAQGEERVLLDPNAMSNDGSVSIGLVMPSWDGRYVAYTLKNNNSDEATLHVREVVTGKEDASDMIPGAKYAEPAWTPRGDGFYYVRVPVDPSIPVADRPGHADVRFHRLGSDPSQDPMVYPPTGDPRTLMDVNVSRDGNWLWVTVHHGWAADDVYFRDLRMISHDRHASEHPFRSLAVGLKSNFSIFSWKNRLYLTTNDGAPRSRVLVVDPERPGRNDWREIVPEDKDAVLEDSTLANGHLLLRYMKNATSRLFIHDLDGRRLHELTLPGLGSVDNVFGDPDDDEVFYAYQSFTEPREVHRASITSGTTTLWARARVPIDPSRYTVEQVWYPSRDGTRVSLFVVHRKDLPRDGQTPFLLSGYGGFNVSMMPTFIGSLYVWLESGGGYAVPNLRGGGEYGEAWHTAGMLAHKQNVFDDFLAAADYLIKEGYTRPERLAIRGGSNGGLLVGAALTQQPARFRAVICAVPLLDMVRYHMFGSGKTWIGEYGSADNEAEFGTLLAYSPYHHVRAGTAYPAVLMLSADSDDRVDPMHARKMVAALQAATSSQRPVLLRIEPHAGHGGADLVKQAVEQSVDAFAFLMHELGMIPLSARAATAGR